MPDQIYLVSGFSRYTGEYVTIYTNEMYDAVNTTEDLDDAIVEEIEVSSRKVVYPCPSCPQD